jgi:hypothetical protein
MMHELGMSLEEEFGSEIQRQRTILVGQASTEIYDSKQNEMDAGEPRISLLNEIDTVGPHSPIIRGFIRRDFNRLVSDVTKARIAVLVKKTVSKEIVPESFGELASLNTYEVKRLLRPTLRPERKIGVSRKIAAELVEGRCDLDVSTILKYAQPGRPKAKHKKKI